MKKIRQTKKKKNDAKKRKARTKKNNNKAKMCEWLSCREWCDVQLQCGGKTLNAHRAVLASVSRFLKQLLLSCPSEDTPTFIILPDFDYEAMCSVLYYVYNGEVMLEKHKLEMFLHIIKAMQIFVDENCYSKCDFSEETVVCRTMDIKPKETAKSADQPCINIKRKKLTHDKLHPSSVDPRDKHATQARFWDCSMQRSPSSENPQLPYEDRQRSSYLRDLYIETYPWNGNSNGRVTGVPEIPNIHYRDSTSASLTNANCGHPTANLDAAVYNQTGSAPGLQLAEIIPNPNLSMSSILNYAKNYHNEKLTWDLRCTSILSEITLSKQPTSSMQRSLPFANLLSLHSRSSSSLDQRISSLNKNTILNKVLDNPWCPHPPKNYKPFRRKKVTMSTVTNNVQDCKIPIVNENDSNNNVQDLAKTNEIKDLIHEESREISNINSEDTSRSDYKCDICSQIFTSTEALSCHTKHHTSSRYSCTECSKSFSQLRNFKYHMSIHRGTREFAATCSVCGKYFNDRGYLSSHMKIHRNRKEYKCPQCPKSFNQRVAYNMHVRIHTGVKPHVCGECGKAFSRKMLLKQHQRTHSGERPYACAHCDKRFADRSNMTLHLRLHTGVKPFSCSLCPKSFTKKHHLKSHLNFHTGAKPYSCPRCKLAFTQSSNMRTHFKKCNAPAPEDIPKDTS